MVADSIQNSFNRIDRSNVSQPVRDNLKKLTEAVAEATNHMAPEIAKRAASDLETFTNEAISEKPRKKWYELSAEGLMEAAKTVGEIGAPIIKCVSGVLGLLSQTTV